MRVSTNELREIIETSMANEFYARKVKWVPKKKRPARCWVEGKRKLVMRNDGLLWMHPKEVPEEATWRREQRRRKLMARWESPPPGPSGVWRQAKRHLRHLREKRKWWRGQHCPEEEKKWYISKRKGGEKEYLSRSDNPRAAAEAKERFRNRMGRWHLPLPVPPEIEKGVKYTG